MESKRIPARRSSPGRILKRELDARGWTQKDFAEIIGRPEQVISEIINGIKQITPETAIEFSKAFGTSAEFWNNLESNYQLWLAQKSANANSIERRAFLYQQIPVAELKMKGWLPNTKDTDVLEKCYLDLMKIPSIDVVPTCSVLKRQSTIREGKILAEVIWIKRVEYLISSQKLRKFRLGRLKNAIPDLLNLSNSLDKISLVPEFMLNHGIHFALVPHLSNTKIDGAYFWINKSPVIALSLRYDRIDSFWFTLMHEIAHLVSGHEGNLIETTINRDKKASGVEAAADIMARDWLVKKEGYKRFVARTKPFFSARKITEFSELINRHPGLVLGRLQHDGHIPWKNLKKLQVKVKSYLSDFFDKPF